jgi:S-adenosylmethionine:diacylglycerol 3-amino-3-carboxypropyl transferase
MHEDWLIEADVLPGRGRIFCIASAGCTAFMLASRGASVTAVDVNPAQIGYVRERLEGAEPRAGVVEGMLARLRKLGPLAGWSSEALADFCALDDCRAQVDFWRTRLDTRRFRAGLALLLSPPSLRLAYSSPLVDALPPRFDGVVRGRLERCFSLHPNCHNPYARFLLLGEGGPPDPEPGIDVTLACADAAAYLEQSAPASFDGFALSNILDGASPAYAQRLLSAIRHAASPRAVVVLRSFGHPATAQEESWAARDRSLVWGSVRVEDV